MTILAQEVAASDLLMKGWEVIHLPAGQKAPPPVGSTGRRGKALDEETLFEALAEGRQVGIRLPRGVIGIDVDGYKDNFSALKTLEARLGNLPVSWAITSHGLYRSFTILFAVPEAAEWAESAANTIDVIQHHHRYLAAPPSLHPSGARYSWTLAGEPTRAAPEVSMLPVLPQAWQDYLRLTEPHRASQSPLMGAIDLGGSGCPIMGAVTSRALAGFSSRGRHDALVAGSWSIASLASKGHRGGAAALDRLRSEFLSRTAGEGREAEAEKAIAGALEKIGGSTERACSCGRGRVHARTARSGWLKAKA